MRGPALGKHCVAVGPDWEEVHWAPREAADRRNLLLFLYFSSAISRLARVGIVEKLGREHLHEWAREKHREMRGPRARQPAQGAHQRALPLTLCPILGAHACPSTGMGARAVGARGRMPMPVHRQGWASAPEPAPTGHLSSSRLPRPQRPYGRRVAIFTGQIPRMPR